VVNGKVGIVAALAVLIAGGLIVRYWLGDERAIRKQLAVIEEAGSKLATEPALEGLVKATQLAGLFADPCQLTVEAARHVGSYPRKQIQDRIVLVRNLYSPVQVSLHDITIDLTRKPNAMVHGTIRLHGQSKGEAIADVQELRARMGKVDGQWLFAEVEIVEVLER
jgi:hypothetical protein